MRSLAPLIFGRGCLRVLARTRESAWVYVEVLLNENLQFRSYSCRTTLSHSIDGCQWVWLKIWEPVIYNYKVLSELCLNFLLNYINLYRKDFVLTLSFLSDLQVICATLSLEIVLYTAGNAVPPNAGNCMWASSISLLPTENIFKLNLKIFSITVDSQYSVSRKHVLVPVRRLSYSLASFPSPRAGSAFSVCFLLLVFLPEWPFSPFSPGRTPSCLVRF